MAVPLPAPTTHSCLFVPRSRAKDRHLLGPLHLALCPVPKLCPSLCPPAPPAHPELIGWAIFPAWPGHLSLPETRHVGRVEACSLFSGGQPCAAHPRTPHAGLITAGTSCTVFTKETGSRRGRHAAGYVPFLRRPREAPGGRKDQGHPKGPSGVRLDTRAVSSPLLFFSASETENPTPTPRLSQSHRGPLGGSASGATGHCRLSDSHWGLGVLEAGLLDPRPGQRAPRDTEAGSGLRER